MNFYTKGKHVRIRIIATTKMLQDLSDKNIDQYFTDGTYKCVPKSIDYAVLVICMGLNVTKSLKKLCFLALLENEEAETYQKLYKILKFEYNFEPKYINVDFQQSNINALKIEFQNTIIIPCFFH
jgi:hypothetical protein